MAAITMVSSTPLSVFISYAHQDEASKDDLVRHLANLQRQGKIWTWQVGILNLVPILPPPALSWFPRIGFFNLQFL